MFLKNLFRNNNENICKDIITEIENNSINKKELDEKVKKIKNSIETKSYSLKQLNDFIEKFTCSVNKENFTSSDLNNFNISMKSEIENNLDGNGEIIYQDILKDILYSVTETIKDMVISFLEVVIVCIIIINLSFRSNYPSKLYYPNDQEKFPYVYYDDKNSNNQTHLISSKINDNYNSDDTIFKNIQIKKGDGNEKNNYCNINDPYNVTKTCTQNNSENETDFMKYIKKNISFENMNFFAKLFIESNGNKSSDELNIYSMITFVLLTTSYKLNNVLGKMDGLFQGLFKFAFPNKDQDNDFKNNILSIFLMLFFYGYIYLNISNNNTTTNNVSSNDDKTIDNLINNTFGEIIKTIITPFLKFFMILFIIMYPFSIFYSMTSYFSYYSLSSSFLVKIICFLGSALTFLNGLLFFYHDENTGFYHIIKDKIVTNNNNKDTNIDVEHIFCEMIQNLVKDVQYYIKFFYSFEESFKEGYGDDDDIRKEYNAGTSWTYQRVTNDTLRKWDVPDQYNTEIQQAMSSVEKSTRDEVLDYCSNRPKRYKIIIHSSMCDDDPKKLKKKGWTTYHEPASDLSQKKGQCSNYYERYGTREPTPTLAIWSCMLQKGYVPNLYGNGWVLPKSEGWDEYGSKDTDTYKTWKENAMDETVEEIKKLCWNDNKVTYMYDGPNCARLNQPKYLSIPSNDKTYCPWHWLTTPHIRDRLKGYNASQASSDDIEEEDVSKTPWNLTNDIINNEFGDIIDHTKEFVTCNPNGISAFSLNDLIKLIIGAILGPMFLFFLIVPLITNLHLVFSCVKKLTIDYIYYINNIFEIMKNHKNIILFVFMIISYTILTRIIAKQDVNSEYESYNNFKLIRLIIFIAIIISVMFSSSYIK